MLLSLHFDSDFKLDARYWAWSGAVDFLGARYSAVFLICIKANVDVCNLCNCWFQFDCSVCVACVKAEVHEQPRCLKASWFCIKSNRRCQPGSRCSVNITTTWDTITLTPSNVGKKHVSIIDIKLLSGDILNVQCLLWKFAKRKLKCILLCVYFAFSLAIQIFTMYSCGASPIEGAGESHVK